MACQSIKGGEKKHEGGKLINLEQGKKNERKEKEKKPEKGRRTSKLVEKKRKLKETIQKRAETGSGKIEWMLYSFATRG